MILRHLAPGACPVCNSPLQISGLECTRCDTEVHGHFRRCEFCHLDDDQRALLIVFLRARGNTKELERHLGVSYPTARARLDDVLKALSITPTEPSRRGRRAVLDALAAGELDVDAALEELQ